MRVDQDAVDEAEAGRLEEVALGERCDAALGAALAQRQAADDHRAGAAAGEHDATALDLVAHRIEGRRAGAIGGEGLATAPSGRRR